MNYSKFKWKIKVVGSRTRVFTILRNAMAYIKRSLRHGFSCYITGPSGRMYQLQAPIGGAAPF